MRRHDTPVQWHTARTVTPWCVLACLLAMGPWPREASAQVRLTLAEATRRALAASPDLAIRRDDVDLAAQAAARARGAYDVLLRVDGRGRVRTDPVNSILSGAPAGALAPRVTSVGGTVGFTRLFASGATLGASTGISRDTTNSTLAALSPSWATSVTLDFRQPLLQGRAIDPTRRALRVAAVDRARSIASLTRAVSDLVARTERAYWSLVAARRDLEVRQRALALALRQREDTQARIEAGVAAESDLAAPLAEIERRRTDVAVAEERVARADHQLKALVAPRPDDPLWQAVIEPADAPEGPDLPLGVADVDVEEAVRTAIRQRPEIAEARTAVDRQEVELASARDRLRPQLDLVAAYALRGLAGGRNDARPPFGGFPVIVADEQVGSAWQSYGTLVTHRFADASIGLAYAVPIGQRAARADIAIAELGRRQAQSAVAQAEDRVGVEVRDAVVALRAAARRLAAARAARQAAEVQLQAEQDRYETGLTINFFVLARQNDLAAAELAELTALVDQHLAYTDYLRATGALLEARGLVIDAPGRREEGR